MMDNSNQSVSTSPEQNAVQESTKSYLHGGLEDRSVVVTGASSGIGRAIAYAMAEAGARLALVGRDAQRLATCEQTVRARSVEAHVVQVDITSEDGPQAVVNQTLRTLGSIDVLVHCAGIFEPIPFTDTPLENLDRHWAINVRAPFALTQQALPHLSPGSSVIFISSIAGHAAFPNSTAYCSTKGATELLVRSLAAELAPKDIRVNAVAPGNIHTPMNADQFAASPAYEASLVGKTPAGRIGEVEDIAPSVVFLASEAARYIHGATLLVDGGWIAQR